MREPTRPALPTQAAQQALLAYVALAATLLGAAALMRWNLWTYGSDTGTFAQAIANTWHGFSNELEGGTHFRFHFSPILALLWPLVALTRSPLSLQFVQIALLVSCPLLIAAILKPYLPEPWPARCGLLALLYPPMLAAAFSEFHELAFYPPLVLGLLLAADRARWGWFAALSLLAVCVREDASIDLIVIGLVLALIGALRRHSREHGMFAGEPHEPERLVVAGAGLALCACASLAVYAFIVLPRAGAWAPSHFYEYPFAHGPLQTALALFTHPLQLFAAIATTGRLTYLLEALAPLAFLPLFSRWSLLAVPGLAGVLLASDASVWRMGMHYELLWTPFALLGASLALAKFVGARYERRASAWWRTACALCVLVLLAFNPMHPAHYLRAAPFAHNADALRALACVPHVAPVAMHDEWFAREALVYPRATVLGATPEAFHGYVIYDRAWQNPLFAQTLPKLEQAVRAGTFVSACSSGSVQVLRATEYRRAE